MSNLSKPMSQLDANQTLQTGFNESDASYTVTGFVSSKLGNNVQRTGIDSVTDDYSFYDGATLLYTIRVVYSDSTHANINSATRTA